MEIFHRDTFYGQNAVFNSALIQQGRARSQRIWGKEGSEEKVKKTTSELLNQIHPTYWNARVKGNADVETEKQFAYLILAIEQHTRKDLDTIPMLGFYHTSNFIKDTHEAQNKK